MDQPTHPPGETEDSFKIDAAVLPGETEDPFEKGVAAQLRMPLR